MSVGPKKIYLDHVKGSCVVCSSLKHVFKTPVYISADLVDKLIGFSDHDKNCHANGAPEQRCTCGLTELIREVRNE